MRVLGTDVFLSVARWGCGVCEDRSFFAKRSWETTEDEGGGIDDSGKLIRSDSIGGVGGSSRLALSEEVVMMLGPRLRHRRRGD